MIGRKVGGMRIVRIGPFTLMLCKRKQSDAARKASAAKRSARRRMIRDSAKLWRSIGVKLWNAEFDAQLGAFEPDVMWDRPQ